MPDQEPLHDQRYAPPATHVEDVDAAAGGQVLATRGQRFGAVLIDVGVIIAAMWLISLVTPWNPWNIEEGRSLWQPVFLDTALGFALFAVIQGVPLARRGQTIGKLAVGIRIARPDGSAVSLGRLLGLRYGVGYAMTIVPAFGQIYAIVDALLIFRTSRRCLHDQIADTIVLKV